MQAAKTIKAHWAGVLHYVVTRKTNAVLEGINSLVHVERQTIHPPEGKLRRLEPEDIAMFTISSP